MQTRRSVVLLLTAIFLSRVASAGVNRWTTGGPNGGWIQALAADPTDLNVIYAGTNGGGVFRSTDGGVHWAPGNAGWSPEEGFSATSLVVTPQWPATVYSGSNFGGVMQSTDGGRTWRQRKDGFDYYGSAIRGLAIDPVNPSTLYAATLRGVFRSDDGGCEWIETNAGLPIVNDTFFYTNGVVVDPTDPSILYLGSDASGLYKSVDAGASWNPSNNGVLYPRAGAPAIDPTNPSHLLMTNDLFISDVGGGTGTILESDDGGASWHPASATLPNGFYSTVAFDPQQPTTVWAASFGLGVFRSDDAGDTWVPSSHGLVDLRVGPLLVGPGQRLLAGTRSDGVWRSDDRGATWSPSREGLSIAPPIMLGFAASQPSALYLSSLINPAGFARSADGGLTWSPAGPGLLSPAEGRAVAVDPNDSDVVYFSQFQFGAQANQAFKSTDGGSSWSPIGESLPFGAMAGSFAVDPADSQHVLAGGREILVSTDGGGSWNPAALPLPNASSLRFRGAGLVVGLAGGLFKVPWISTDNGDHWTPAGDGLPETVICVAVDPSDPSTMYVGTAGDGLFVTTNGGTAWVPVAEPLLGRIIHATAVDPSDAAHLVVSTVTSFAGGTWLPTEGVLESFDGGAAWTPLNRGLENPPSRELGDIAFTADGQTLIVASHAGVYRYTYSPTDPPAPALVTPFHGPAAGGTSFTLTGAGFQDGAQVLVGGAAASGVTVVNATTITATTPSGSSGAADVRVQNSDGQFATLPRGFVYDFDDVPPESDFYEPVAALTQAGATVGCGGSMYCPQAPLTRAQAAVILERALHGADVLLPKAPGDFIDVLRCSPEGPYVFQMAFEGITVGCGDFVFCPTAPSTRAQAAVFILKAEHGEAYTPPPPTGTVFADVPADAFAAGYIEQLAAEGIAVGCGGGLFCPENALTRGQAAAYVALSLLP